MVKHTQKTNCLSVFAILWNWRLKGYKTSSRLDIKLSESMIFTQPTFLPQPCYVKYVHSRSSAILDSEINYVRKFGKLSLIFFFSNVNIKTIYKKEAYLLLEILKGVSIIGETR